jgi:hypothetical protein
MTSRQLKIVVNLAWLPALAVGALQMVHVRAGALTDYGADFFGPIALYASTRSHGSILRWVFSKGAPSAPLSAVIVLAGCVAWEFCQLFDLSGTPLAITKGHFDPGDLAAYAIGVATAFATEKAYLRKRRTDAAA